MDRRDFLKVSSVSLMAMGTDDVAAKIWEPSEDKKEGMAIRFLGTGAADWNGPDNRGEQRRLSSILVDKNVLFDFTAGMGQSNHTSDYVARRDEEVCVSASR